MPKAAVNGVELEYEVLGEGNPDTLTLVMGLGAQMTRWPPQLVQMLVDRGFRVIRFDNRDCGLSTAFKQGDSYVLTDMASDVVALLDHLGVQKTHLVGVSMGGMIGQLVAAMWPDRVLSFTSVMSATGAPGTLNPTPEANAVLTTPAPNPQTDFEAFLAHGVKNARTIGSPGYPQDEAVLRERVEADYRRAFNPYGVLRQRQAIQADGDRTERLKAVTAPTVVLHGADDPLVPLAGGQATAKAIAGAELRVIPGMGHDLPPQLYDTLVDAIMAAVTRAKQGAN